MEKIRTLGAAYPVSSSLVYEDVSLALVSDVELGIEEMPSTRIASEGVVIIVCQTFPMTQCTWWGPRCQSLSSASPSNFTLLPSSRFQ